MPMPSQGKIRDEMYMRRCIDLASKGRPAARKNPLVGCCIVYHDRIIGEGHHEKYGEAHAEIQALNSIKKEDVQYLPQSTLYVTLAPCNHVGKTPPCAQAILKSGIRSVIIGTDDTTAEANGGIQTLMATGVQVTVGVLESDARNLVKPFLIGKHTQRPYVTLKWAESSDGFMGRQNERITISSPSAQLFVHDLRRRSNGILIGAGTAILDDPSLTTRAVPGSNPLRIVIKGERVIPLDHKLFTDDESLLVFDQSPSLLDITHPLKKVHSIADLSISAILSQLYTDYDIGYLLVEGGANLLGQFIQNDLWDECFRMKSKVSLGHGVKSPLLSSQPHATFSLGEDRIDHFEN